MSSGEKDEGKCLPRKRDAFLELWAFKLPNRAHFGGYNPPAWFCCWVIEETTKPAEGALILSVQDHGIF